MTTYLHPVAEDGPAERDEQLLRAQEEIAELREALESGRIIGAAVGIVMERFDLDAEAALAFLKRVSSQHNRRLRDLATELMQTRRLPSGS
jgi:AmiR/NasT family two-component response regulator